MKRRVQSGGHRGHSCPRGPLPAAQGIPGPGRQHSGGVGAGRTLPRPRLAGTLLFVYESISRGCCRPTFWFSQHVETHAGLSSGEMHDCIPQVLLGQSEMEARGNSRSSGTQVSCCYKSPLHVRTPSDAVCR